VFATVGYEKEALRRAARSWCPGAAQRAAAAIGTGTCRLDAQGRPAPQRALPCRVLAARKRSGGRAWLFDFRRFTSFLRELGTRLRFPRLEQPATLLIPLMLALPMTLARSR